MMFKEISSPQHPLVKYLVKVRSDRAYRKQTGSALITGSKLLTELKNIVSFKTILIENEFPFSDFPKNIPTYRLPLALLKKITGLQHPEPVAAEVALPPFQSLSKKNYLVALDGISDPGNLGTLLRTAFALNWEGAFILSHSTDPFNDKALRAAKGATFRLPLSTGSWDDLKELIKNNHMHAYLADIKGQPLEQTTFQTPVLLILGNEAHGASQIAKELSTPVSIPMNPLAESLNVAAAGAILMYQVRS